MHHTADATFPNGIPNPLLLENHAATADVVKAEKADFGVAFDGDFDRCFFFDETGQFVPGEYVVGLLASIFLEKEAGAKIVHDPRVVWNTQDIVAQKGGIAVQSKTGHAFIKQTMRSHRGGLRRRDVGAPLLPRLCLLRQRHDPVAFDCRTCLPLGSLAWGLGEGSPCRLPQFR